MVTLSLCVDLISLKIACDFVMNSVHYSKNTSSVLWLEHSLCEYYIESAALVLSTVWLVFISL